MKIFKMMNNKGTILQIVLIIFIVLIMNIGTLCQISMISQKSFLQSKQLNQTRLLTNLTIAYFKHKNKNDILLSDQIETQDYKIHYTVDDMGDYFYIECQQTANNHTIEYSVELNREDNTMRKMEYK